MVKRKYNKKKRVARKPKSVPRSNYRSTIPRTIQIATKRNKNMKLKFTLNQTWLVDPSKLANPNDTAVLSYRANSIFQSHMPTAATATAAAFVSQDPALYNNNGQAVPLIQQSADGFDTWSSRFQHFTVTGSKITYTFEPYSTGAPSILCSHVSGVSGAIQASTSAVRLNALPYTTRHSIVPQAVTSGIFAATGLRGSRTYSARAFEGVVDPVDNSNLRGRFANSLLTPPVTGASPSEQSFFYIAIAPIDPATTVSSGQGVLRVKIEYIAHLREPTESNQVQMQTTGTADAAHEL
ncbi:MAG: putative capsid protein [Circoviridae sp.]|nr:MAG: putative capsid protein [Circoviridae sp.]